MEEQLISFDLQILSPEVHLFMITEFGIRDKKISLLGILFQDHNGIFYLGYYP